MGFLYPLIRAIGTPGLVYQALPKLGTQFNKISVAKVVSARRGHADIEYHPVDAEHAERSPLICRIRRAHLAAGPVIWGLPAAQLEELECQTRGDPRCLYRLRWAERSGIGPTVLGLVAGAGAGFLLGGLPLLFALAAAGALAGRLFSTRRQLQDVRAFNDTQRVGLEQAVSAADRRFADLERAKAEVDQKVEDRTVELRKTSADLATSLQSLEQLGKVKNEFLANVSHELRTPLTLILAPLEELLGGEVRPAEAQDYLKAMHRSATRLNTLVTDLLELARLQAGHLRLAVSEQDPFELVSGIAEQFRALATHRGITLAIERNGEPGRVHVDPGRLEFVFTNLLSNAMKFTPQGGRITVRVSGTDDGVAVDVDDTGAGIPAELQGRVFERFSRFDNPDAPGAAGAGIGLALVKELVELHGGQVGLRSTLGQGTCITVSLVRGKEHLQPEILDRRRADVPVPYGRRSGDSEMAVPGAATAAALTAATEDEQAAQYEAAAPTAPAGAPRVLVIEDNDDMRAFVRRILSRRYQVIEAPDGLAGVEAARRERPDVIVSDLMMPGIDGYEVCRRLKADPMTRITPIILLTAKKDRAWALEGFQSGADDYVGKPFNAQELLARINVQLRLRQLMTERAQTEKLAVLGTVAAGMAHEVRNPAGAILSTLPKVRRVMDKPGDMPEAAKKMVDTAIDCAQRISTLVGDLLELGQPEREGPRTWNPHEGLESALRVFAHRTGPDVEIRRKLGWIGEIVGRPAALNQIFLNLLDNALRAVGEKGWMEIETRADAGGFALSVSDSGPGVSPELAARIFDPFFTTREVGQGTGLGLHISRAIALEHGGRLEVSRATGGGACFTLWLPGAREEKAA
jgi:signal transduction histidine kinase